MKNLYQRILTTLPKTIACIGALLFIPACKSLRFRPSVIIDESRQSESTYTKPFYLSWDYVGMSDQIQFEIYRCLAISDIRWLGTKRVPSGFELYAVTQSTRILVNPTNQAEFFILRAVNRLYTNNDLFISDWNIK